MKKIKNYKNIFRILFSNRNRIETLTRFESMRERNLVPYDWGTNYQYTKIQFETFFLRLIKNIYTFSKK
jgi:hypothetical protein